MVSETEQIDGTRPVLRKARYIDTETAEWASEAVEVMRQHGRVCGTVIYERRHVARWRVRHLIQVITDLQLAPRWELREHVERRHGGWMWTLEHVKDN